MRASTIFGQSYEIDAVGNVCGMSSLGDIDPTSIKAPPGFVYVSATKVTAENQLGYPNYSTPDENDSAPIGTTVVTFAELATHMLRGKPYHTIMQFWYDPNGKLIASFVVTNANDASFDQMMKDLNPPAKSQFNYWWLAPIGIGLVGLLVMATRKSKPQVVRAQAPASI